MSQDSVEIHAQQVANGLGVWEQAAATLEAHWKEVQAKITPLLGAQTWGGDAPGQAFSAKFEEPANNYTRGTGDGSVNQTVDKIAETGVKVRTVVEASLGSDQMQAAEVAKVKVPGWGGKAR